MQIEHCLRHPFSGAKKNYISGQVHPFIRVPMRQIHLSNHEVLNVYDTSGPYTDSDVLIDVSHGLIFVVHQHF